MWLAEVLDDDEARVVVDHGRGAAAVVGAQALVKRAAGLVGLRGHCVVVRAASPHCHFVMNQAASCVVFDLTISAFPTSAPVLYRHCSPEDKNKGIN